MLRWLAQNYQWIFSGIGVLIVSLVFHQWRKSKQRRQSNTEVNNSLLTHSTVSSGSHNTQTVSATTIHAQTVNLHPAISASSHDDLAKTQKPQPNVKHGFVVGIGLLVAVVVLAVLYFFSPKIPGVPKPGLIVDAHGHIRGGDANRAENTVMDLQDTISDLIPYKDRVQYDDYERRNLKDAPYLAERISKISDASLRPRYRYLKYEYAAFAYVEAAARAMFEINDRSRVDDYASQATENANEALSILKAAEQKYDSDEESMILRDWVNKDDGKDRVLYLKAEAACMLGTIRNNAALESQALEMWNQISSTYRADFPAAGTLQLNGCVPMEKSN